jgi:polysaccharide export outer membrane protein
MDPMKKGSWARRTGCRQLASEGGVWTNLCSLVLAASVALGGCHSMLNAWLDPSQVGRFRHEPRSLEIRSTLTFQDDPLGLPGAMEPTPEDLVAFVTEYRVGPGDTLLVEVRDLEQPNIRSQDQLGVNELGYINVPILGVVKAEGLTASEIEAAISKRLIEGMILREPSVTVFVPQRTQNVYSVLDQVARPGRYSIPSGDFRLLDAIAVAGDVTGGTVYVIRQGPLPKQTVPGAEDRYVPELETQPTGERMPSPYEPLTRPPGSSEAPLPVPGEQDLHPGLLPTDAFLPSDTRPSQSNPPATQTAQDDEMLELLKALGMRPTTSESTVPLTTAGTQPAAGPNRLVMGEGRAITDEAVETQPATGPTAERAPALPREAWEILAQPEEGQARIISIPIDLLKQGEARYNIVIRPGDMIRVPPRNQGEFYMMGHVIRPGVYSLAGRDITLKQAIAAAGGLDALAWPSRVDIIRRFGENRQEIVPVDLDKIFAGQAPDFFIRPNDVINVGTHPIAPFMAVIRNAFRFSYGVAFTYDRNFADIDSYTNRQNPVIFRQQERQQRQAARGGSLSLGAIQP